MDWLSDHQLGTDDHQFGTADHQLGTVDHQFGIVDHQPGTADHQFGTADNDFGITDSLHIVDNFIFVFSWVERFQKNQLVSPLSIPHYYLY